MLEGCRVNYLTSLPPSINPIESVTHAAPIPSPSIILVSQIYLHKCISLQIQFRIRSAGMRQIWHTAATELMKCHNSVKSQRKGSLWEHYPWPRLCIKLKLKNQIDTKKKNQFEIKKKNQFEIKKKNQIETKDETEKKIKLNAKLSQPRNISCTIYILSYVLIYVKLCD